MKKYLWISCFVLVLCSSQVSAIVMPSHQNIDKSNQNSLNPALWTEVQVGDYKISSFSTYQNQTISKELITNPINPISSIPEPSTLLLFALGIAALGLRRTLKLN